MKRRILVAAVYSALMAVASVADAEDTAVAPPAGAALLLRVTADGVQIYACETTDTGRGWVFKAPEAALFDSDGRQIGTHFAGPTWKLADGSAVVGEVAARGDAPSAGAIPWLLLRVMSHDGGGSLANAAFIRRIDTQGGAAPKPTCDAAHIAEQARMRYSAIYEFYAAPK
ncbi:MAG TPA: DUF3455 domain-containing protein [Stellaceae bacterium]|nr:DUF3455 domain-containing protein [Stellaceae bacterium]